MRKDLLSKMTDSHRRSAVRPMRLITGLMAAFLAAGVIMCQPVGSRMAEASESPIVFDDYVGETTAAQSEYTEPEYEEDASFEDQGGSYGADAEAENNDGDDVYISNNGTVFRIPRAEDPSERVFDYAGLFTEEQHQALRDKIAELEKKKKCTIVLLMPKDVPYDINNGTETSQKYMRQFYIDNGFEKDGVGFIIDLDNRVLWSIGSGKYKTNDFVDFTEEVYNACLGVARKGDFYAAAEVFLDRFDAYGNVARAAIPTPLSLIISAVAAFLGMAFFNAQHARTQPSKATTPALQVRNYRQLNHDEHYLGTTVTRRRLPSESKSGGGGGGGFSGGFSSGGFSSGGGSFSGGGGKF